jgi:hypothetical protein
MHILNCETLLRDDDWAYRSSSWIGVVVRPVNYIERNGLVGVAAGGTELQETGSPRKRVT